MLIITSTLHAFKSHLHILHSSNTLLRTHAYTYTHTYTLTGGDSLDNLLYCSVEKNDCVHVPGKEQTGWNIDKLSDLPTKPSKTFNMVSLQGMYMHILYILLHIQYIYYTLTVYIYLLYVYTLLPYYIYITK